ncbi:TetR/AcrR family transcriptional regulator [Microbacterium sp. ISL-103]|uniref:TetR/AcrR family transcriptional regulator n=1 Tax=Microbacterium sp. ISL-103 TaxID=2819156 RepID=UPI002035DFE9|nr:TetR/AcrR family transcriptional regulator [Microbacterium sp. ISL-103]
MPRVVDANARSAEIIDAAVKILSEGGFVKLTLSNLARELGGSMRLVTHYYADRPALVQGILDKMMRETDEVLAEIAQIDSPERKVRHTLDWFLLPDERSIREEKVRIALLVHKDVEPAIQRFFDAVEPAMRNLLREALSPVVPEEELEAKVDLTRVWTGGLALSVIEHPEAWPQQRQAQVMNEFLNALGLR